MEERHKKILLKQNSWWMDEKIALPEFKRDLFKNFLKYVEYKQIVAVVGLRRTGKTILMKQMIEFLLKKTKKNNICYISFDDRDFQNYDLAGELINYFLEFSDNKEKRYLFLDEIQKVPNWADLLKTYYDTEKNLKIFVSGSASLEIKEHKETLAGRIFPFYLPVLTFKEFVRYFKMPCKISLENLFRGYELEFITKKEKYAELFNLYLVKGAFPELLDIKDEDFIKKYINELVEKVIRDTARITEEKENVLVELLRLLVNSNAQLFEIVNLASILKINRNLISYYIHLLEKSFLIKISSNFTSSVAKQVRVSKRQYIAHSSIVISQLDYPFTILNTEVVGHLVEAVIANQLGKISFWRTSQKKEVDIIIKDKNKITPIEVKYQNQITKADVKNILFFMKKKNLEKGVVITKNLLKKEKRKNKKLIYIPAWLFLLCI